MFQTLCGIFVVSVIVAVANAALTMGRGLKEVKGREEVEEGTMSVVEVMFKSFQSNSSMYVNLDHLLFD